MSSTTTTSRPLMSESRSWRIRHPPRVRREPRDRHEVELDRDLRDRPGQVGDEQQRALQHADEHDAVGMIGFDLRREPADVAGERVGVEQDRRGHVSP